MFAQLGPQETAATGAHWTGPGGNMLPRQSLRRGKQGHRKLGVSLPLARPPTQTQTIKEDEDKV